MGTKRPEAGERLSSPSDSGVTGLVSDLHTLLLDRETCDVVFVVGKAATEFRAHRLMLWARYVKHTGVFVVLVLSVIELGRFPNTGVVTMCNVPTEVRTRITMKSTHWLEKLFLQRFVCFDLQRLVLSRCYVTLIVRQIGPRIGFLSRSRCVLYLVRSRVTTAVRSHNVVGTFEEKCSGNESQGKHCCQ